MTQEALKLALEALLHVYHEDEAHPKTLQAINAIKEALAQSEQEPVAWLHWLHGPVRLFLNKDEAMMDLNRLNREYPVDKDARQMKPLYTTPPQRKPLTDEQIGAILEDPNIAEKHQGNWLVLPYAYARAIEAAHGIKEKNT